MIDPAYCQLLARYNRWMNERIYAAADELGEAARVLDRGAFFGSIHRTLSHLVWGDRIWLARFTGTRYGERAYGADLYRDFATLARDRDATDTALLDWAGNVTQEWLASTFRYHRSSDGKDVDITATEDELSAAGPSSMKREPRSLI